MASASHSRTARGSRRPSSRGASRNTCATEVYQGNLDKRAAYADLKAKLGLADEEIAYFGDDLVDLPIMGQVGFPAAVADAVQEVREVAVLQSDYPGGHGAVRQLIEFILKAQGKWEDLVAGFQAKKSMEGLAQ